MSVMDALGAAAKCYEVAMMVYQQYQMQKEVAASVGQYVSIVKLYQSSLTRLSDYIAQEQKNHSLRIQDPQWAEDMKTFQGWAEEDQKDAQYLHDELVRIQNNKWWKNMFQQAQDRFQDHQTRIYKKLEIIKFFMTMDMWKSGNKDRKDIDFAITDEEGRYFWHEHIGSSKRETSVEGLVGALQQFLSETQHFRNIEQNLLKVVKITADTIVSNDQITIYEYSTFISKFGPLSQILKKASAVCTIDGKPQPWFRAIADRRKLEAEFQSQLQAYDAAHPTPASPTSTDPSTSPRQHGFSTWVIRFSSEPKEHFVWSYIFNRKLFHVLVRNSPKGYHLKDPPKNHHDLKYYETVVDLVAGESERMGFTVDRSHVKEWQDLIDENTTVDPEGESRYATMVDDEDFGDEMDEPTQTNTATNITTTTTTTTTTANTTTAATTTTPTSPAQVTLENKPVESAAAARANTVTQKQENTSPTTNTSSTNTTAPAATTTTAEPKKLDHVNGVVHEPSPPAATPAAVSTPAPASSTPAPAASSSPAPSPAPASASSDAEPVADEHVNVRAARTAAAAADALERAKDLTIAAPDPRATKPKAMTQTEHDDDTARRGPAETVDKKPKGCCSVM